MLNQLNLYFKKTKNQQIDKFDEIKIGKKSLFSKEQKKNQKSSDKEQKEIIYPKKIEEVQVQLLINPICLSISSFMIKFFDSNKMIENYINFCLNHNLDT
ncbi:hypothetical protein BpHYR1_015526 [Brachionus plicatilis]|uniref:Uncharacterized protein n=1 Tax=Brachionus plicatilis TaxID=10195 RepID=A0A3M7RJ90_BRAPC|nr:hypothetical protein BpHYR1_015526 [Brachionus plicatilis]